jgi:nucleotide-binding universal stress UspA family protein
MPASIILVGYDGSPHAGDALALARVVAEARGAETVLGRVVPSSSGNEEHTRRARERLQELAERERVGAEVSSATSPANGLHDLAQELDAELIVIGSSHRSSVGQVLAGNVALRLLNGLDRQLGVAPAGYASREHRMTAIGVGYDGSAESRLAVQAATELARRSGAEIELIGASVPHAELVPGPWAFGWQASDAAEDVSERMHGRLDSAGQALPGGVRHSEQFHYGTPARVLTDASDHLDMLVVGSRGYGPARRLLLGSVSGRVAREARCPVLVVPRAAEAGERAA